MRVANETALVNDLDLFTVEIWGCRGTLPVTGLKSLRYGGNTNCITLNLANNLCFIFDAGTGIKELSNVLLKNNQFPFSAHLFLTHPHYDHINGIPFFTPLYMPGNVFTFYGFNHCGVDFKDLISQQMDGVYFPVTTEEWTAEINFRALVEESFNVQDVKVTTMLLNHPGACLGYKIESQGKIFCYVTDNELYLENSKEYNALDVERLIAFIYKADCVIMDATYTDEEYTKKIGWGHSCISRVVEVADKAKVKLLCLHHHDPDQTDDDIDAKLEQAKSLLRARQSLTQCIAPAEGEKIIF